MASKDYLQCKDIPIHSTLTTKGQITLPKLLRDQLHLSPGDRIEFIVGADNCVRMIPRQGSIKNLKAMLPKPSKPVSLEQMDRAIADVVSGK